MKNIIRWRLFSDRTIYIYIHLKLFVTSLINKSEEIKGFVAEH